MSDLDKLSNPSAQSESSSESSDHGESDDPQYKMLQDYLSLESPNEKTDFLEKLGVSKITVLRELLLGYLSTLGNDEQGETFAKLVPDFLRLNNKIYALSNISN